MVEQFRPSNSEEELIYNFKEDAASMIANNQLSLNSCLAIVLLKEGRKRIQEAAGYVQREGGTVAISPDVNDFLTSIKDKGNEDIYNSAFLGIQFLFTGAFVKALEETKTNGVWDNQEYIAYFNEHVKGTPLPGVDLELITIDHPQILKDQEVTSRMLAMISQDQEENRNLFFDNPNSLPGIVRGHLMLYHLMDIPNPLGRAGVIFVETSKRLNNEHQPVKGELTAEQIARLHQFDNMINQRPDPFQKEIDDFLKLLPDP